MGLLPGVTNAKPRFKILGLLFLPFIYFIAIYHPEYIQLIRSRPSSGAKSYDVMDMSVVWTEHMWTEAAHSVQVDGDFDVMPLKNHCAPIVPHHGLVFSCNRANGGIGNVRNQLLGCIKYAMEAGGGLVLPRPVLRSENLLTTATGKTTDFSYMFDELHFRNAIKRTCPRITIYDTDEGLNRLPTILYPQTLGGPPVHGVIISEPERWRERFDVWLQNETETFKIPKPSPQKPLLVEFDQSLLLRQPVDYDGEAIKNTFGRVLQIRSDMRRLAATASYELSKRFNLGLDPEAQLYKQAFFGAHLRTEKDALKAWGDANFDTQSDQYIAQAQAKNLSIMYVATGNPEELLKMEKKAWEKAKIKVVSKYGLLNKGDGDYLRKLTWDQQALVDYEMLLKASDFGGFIKSTFAYNIALRRHIISNVTDPFVESDGVSFADEYSHIYGTHDFKRRKNPWTATIRWAMWP
ncbi:hypothetical protein PVAG01_05277 [Phlyctema vagabunda]|uniref:Alternative oxidase n=1 Tax=Phlyctema vagabunda TaxID=108571 RepID=A0ABR4PJP5_9HELO